MKKQITNALINFFMYGGLSLFITVPVFEFNIAEAGLTSFIIGVLIATILHIGQGEEYN